MKGYINHKLDYYSGNYNFYFLKALVAREGGTQSHIDLLIYLFNYSFYSPLGAYVDLRVISSLLHLLPSKACIFLSYYLQLEEERLGQSLDSSYQIRVSSPIEVLLLNSSIQANTVGNRITALLGGKANKQMGIDLSKLLGIKYEEPNSAYLNERIEQVVDLVRLEELDKSILMELLCNRDRYKALSYICNGWSYSQPAIEELRGLLYEWKY
jgi:hypothetical protein